MKKVKSQGDISSGSALDPIVSYTGFNNTKDSGGMRHSMPLSNFCQWRTQTVPDGGVKLYQSG